MCSFFDAWRSGAYANAIELLHRYFDYTMDSQQAELSIKTYHQYALLHLAVLHADFGCYGEAISSMNECIATGMSIMCSSPTFLLTHCSTREPGCALSTFRPIMAGSPAEGLPGLCSDGERNGRERYCW